MRKKFRGIVISDKVNKTRIVEVARLWQHPLYKKRIKRSKKYLTHDEIGTKVGDRVVIQECRPRSKRKRWEIVEVIK